MLNTLLSNIHCDLSVIIQSPNYFTVKHGQTAELFSVVKIQCKCCIWLLDNGVNGLDMSIYWNC